MRALFCQRSVVKFSIITPILDCITYKVRSNYCCIDIFGGNYDFSVKLFIFVVF